MHGDDGWSNHIDAAIALVIRKPMPYGRGTLGNAPNEIEASYEDAMKARLFGDAEEDSSAVPAFEMQR